MTKKQELINLKNKLNRMGYFFKLAVSVDGEDQLEMRTEATEHMDECLDELSMDLNFAFDYDDKVYVVYF